MKSKIDFINGDTKKSLWKMTFPLFCSMMLLIAYNMVDSLWVGNMLGKNGYAALTNSTAVILIFNAIIMGSGNGISILISQAVGSHSKEKSEKLVATTLIFSAFFSIASTILVEIFLKDILTFMSTPAEIFNDAYLYLSIYLIGYCPIFLCMQFCAIFRSYGDPKFQMVGMLIPTLINGIFDPFLIKISGLQGAAWATVISEFLCIVFSIIYYKKKRLFSIKFNKFSLDEIKPILAACFPAILQSGMPSISSASMLYLVTKYGVTTIAAYGVTSKLEILMFYPAMAFNMALTTIVGQCFGAKNIEKIKDYLKNGVVMGGVIVAVISILVIVFSKQLTYLFIQNSDAAVIVARFFAIISVGYVCYLITSCILGAVCGIGKPGMSMLLNFVYYIVIRIPIAGILSSTTMALDGIWTAILISHVAAAVLAAVYILYLFRNKIARLIETNICEGLAVGK